MDENGTTFNVLNVLIDAKEMLTPSEIGDKLGTDRQKVRYHLNKLIDMGLVIKDGKKYYCQPAFIDNDFLDFTVKRLEEIIPELMEKIYIDPEFERESDKDTVVRNCMKVILVRLF